MTKTRALQWAVVYLLAAGTVSARAQGQANPTLDHDKSFLMMASQSDFNEIKLSQLAVDKSTNPDVKSFAQTMVTDHTALEQQMKPTADKWGVTPATSMDAQHQQLYDKLSGLSGKDFDKEYVKAMDEDHHGAQTLFASEVQTTRDKEFKTQVQSAQKVVDRHTGMADKLARKEGLKPVGSDTSFI
jgi:putative membrane protein